MEDQGGMAYGKALKVTTKSRHQCTIYTQPSSALIQVKLKWSLPSNSKISASYLLFLLTISYIGRIPCILRFLRRSENMMVKDQ